jgi:hypothetical protein
MSFSGNVLGGVGVPRYYLLSEDLITNGSMEDDDNADSIPDSWAAGGGATVAQVNDTTTVFGDYVLSVEDNNIGAIEWVTQTGLTMPSGDINGKSLLAAIWVKEISGTPGGNIHVYIKDNGGALAGTASPASSYTTSSWSLIWIPINNLFSLAGSSNFSIEIFPTNTTASNLGKQYYDNIQVFEIEDTIELAEPTEYRGQGWDKELQTGRQRLIDGSYKEYIDGWRFRCECVWEYMDTTDEADRQLIADHDGLIGFMPHNDVEWGQVCLWDGHLNREYFFNRFVGHTSAIPLVGTEIMGSKPTRT